MKMKYSSSGRDLHVLFIADLNSQLNCNQNAFQPIYWGLLTAIIYINVSSTQTVLYLSVLNINNKDISRFRHRINYMLTGRARRQNV